MSLDNYNGKQIAWVDATPSNPCPKCRRPNWCRVDPDGDWCMCRRVSEGANKSKVDRNGEEYYTHRLTPWPDHNDIPEPACGVENGDGKIADADTLQKVYSALLSNIKLLEPERAELTRRGLNGALECKGYRTLGMDRKQGVAKLIEAGFEKHLPHVPGFVIKEKNGKRAWSIAGYGGLLIPVRDHQGRIVKLMLRLQEAHDGGRFRAISSSKHGGPGPGSPVHFPLTEGQTDTTTVRVTEGPLKADIAYRLSSVYTIGLPSVNSWRRAANALKQIGAKAARVAFDADARTNRNVASHLASLVADLQQKGLAVELEVWNPALGKGIDDLLAAKHAPDVLTGDAVFSRVEEIVAEANASNPSDSPAPPSPPGAPGRSQWGTRPEIDINNRQLSDITDEAVLAILAANNPPNLFTRGSALCRIWLNPDSDEPELQTLNDAAVRGHLARVARWVTRRESKKGVTITSVYPPVPVVEDILSLPSWAGIPRINYIVSVPVFDRQGCLVHQPGYNPASGLYYRDTITIPGVSPSPTGTDVEEARNLLSVELFGDFPFADEASRTHAFALLLILFVRRMIDGPTPLHLVDAPTEGTGKSLLLEVITTLFLGKPADPVSEAENSGEWRKLILSVLLEGVNVIYLDNLNKRLDSGALASVLTSRTCKGRLLGYSRTGTAPNDACWYATGNNVVMSRELCRRTVPCRLDAKVENPSERKSFRHPNILRWVTENRPRLVWAALTLCQAWVAAGRPAGEQKLGKFESWAETIGGILKVAGLPHFLDNLKAFRATAADQATEWAEFVSAWAKRHADDKVGVKELFDLATSNDLLGNVLGDINPRSQRTRLGIALQKQRDRVIGKHRIVANEPDNSGRMQYHLESGEDAEATAGQQRAAEEAAVEEVDMCG